MKGEQIMNWSDRTVNDELDVNRYDIGNIVSKYVKNKFYVNRRYQRKLVWDLNDKEMLIDSILHGIPIPAILLARFDVPGDDGASDILEIVDGLQRVDAIISFVMGKYGIKYDGKICYFDPMANNETFLLSQSGSKLIEKHPESSTLPKDICAEFCRYQIPVIITGKDDSTVEMIFSRINSTGRKISSHDLRQSRAIGDFPDLVRRIASNVRLDNTYDDHILLSEIPQISIGSKKHGYGVDIDTIFWRRHDLISKQNIKESKDEEIIETLLAKILLDDFRKNKDNLDKLYSRGEILNEQIENKIKITGKELLESQFKTVFDTIDMIFNSVNSNFSSYLFEEKRTRNKDECFMILFLALYQLIAEGYSIQHFKNVAIAIKSAKALFKDFTTAAFLDHEKMRDATNSCYCILKHSFTKEITTQNSEMSLEIDRRLGYSKIERQMIEFKIGISDFTASKVNKSVIHDIARTLVAMANTTNATDIIGYVIIGIADSKKAYNNWYSIFNEQAVICNQHYVTGITREACKLYDSVDQYYRTLRQLIENENIS